MTKSEEVDKLDANLDRLYRALGRAPTSSATVTFTGSGALGMLVAVVAIIGIIYAAGEVRVTRAERAADAREMAALRDEIHKVSTEQQTDRIWLQKHDNILSKEKRP